MPHFYFLYLLKFEEEVQCWHKECQVRLKNYVVNNETHYNSGINWENQLLTILHMFTW